MDRSHARVCPGIRLSGISQPSRENDYQRSERPYLTGKILFTQNGIAFISGFTGAVGSDRRTLFITEEFSGHCTGEIVEEDEIELIYLGDGSPFSVAIDSFRQV